MINKERIKKVINIIKKEISKKSFKSYVLILIPFFALDLFTRIYVNKTAFFHWYAFIPNLFSFVWIVFITSISLLFKKRISKILIIIFYILALTFFIVNNVYYSISGTFFDFHLVGLASEGKDYYIDAINNADSIIYFFAIISTILFVLFYRNIKFENKRNYKKQLYILLIFIIIHSLIPFCYGKANKELTWNTWKNPRNIYINFNDNNKSMGISGLYEYTIRNMYITYLKPKKTDDQKEIEFLKDIFSEKKESVTNKFTGKFKNKNIIFLQLEGIDDWVLNKEHMPNTYALLNNSINFKNHYSYYNGGGSTFNSEFAVNTGYVTPITYTQNAYTFNKNNFPYSLAKIFKQLDYKVNAFHMNSGEYYSRKINYSTWSFDKYYGLKDLGEYTNNDYKLDRELINNKLFYKKQFTEKGKFINYLITYSAHMPFSETKGVCKYLLDKELEKTTTKNKKATTTPTTTKKILTEEECVYIQAKETDDMVGLLIQALKDNNLYDNTIIVAYADHYLYTLADKTILDKYKDTKTNLINKTPFFIWSKGQKKIEINKVTSQINILPTVLNLIGIKYNTNNYTGEDVFSKTYKGIAFFSDHSWYDGTYYFKDGKVLKGDEKNTQIIEEKSSYVDYLIKKNDLILKYNYLKEK